MRVHLGGHLSWYDPEKRAWLGLDVRSVPVVDRGDAPGRPTAADLARHLGLPRGEIALVVVNGRVVPLDATLLDNDDRVEFYPPIGGG